MPYYRCKTKGCPERNKSVRKEVIEPEFEAILGRINPSEQVLSLTKAVFVDVWQKKMADRVTRKVDIERELGKIADERAKLVQLIARATNEKVIAAYEERIGSLAEKELVLKNTRMSLVEHGPSIETALEIVFDFLKNPLERWQNGDLHTKRLVLKLVFQEKLAYNRKSGFETAILSLPLRVFTLSEAQNSRLVDE